MTLVANSRISLLTLPNSTQNQPATSETMVGGASTFLQAMDKTAFELDASTDIERLFSRTNAALETALHELDGAFMNPFNPIDDSIKEKPVASVAPVADAIWLANWFQNHSTATVSSPVPLLGSASDQVASALMDASPKPLAMLSSELSSRMTMSISDDSKNTPLILPDKPANALASVPAAAPANAVASLTQPIVSFAQSNSQPASPSHAQSALRSTSMSLGLLDNKFSQNLPTDSGKLRPSEVRSKVPMNIDGSVNLAQTVGFKDFKDVENGRWLPVMPGPAQVRLDTQVGQNFEHHMVNTQAVPLGLGPDAQRTLSLAGTVHEWDEPGSPLPVPAQPSAPATDFSTFPQPDSVLDRVEPVVMEMASKPLGSFSSEASSRIDVPMSDKPKQSPTVLPDKPVNALATVPAATPSAVVASLSLPTSSGLPSNFQPASIEVIILDKKSLKNLSIDGDRLKSMETLSKSTMDMSGPLKFGQPVELKDFKDFGNDRLMSVMPGSGQVTLDPSAGQNFPYQTVDTEAASPGLGPDAQWTSNLADTVNQWVERSLQLADLTVPDAGQNSLQVRIELNGQEATVYFLTDHVQYRDAIESQIQNLSDRLADQGLKLAGSFVGQGSSHNSPQQPSAHSMLSQRPGSEPDSAKVPLIDPALREMNSVPQGRVLDVFA